MQKKRNNRNYLENIYKRRIQDKNMLAKTYGTELCPTSVVKTTFLEIFKTRLDKTRKGFHME